MDRRAIEQKICEAFKGVTLGGGVSLCQARVADRYGDGFTGAELAALVHPEITDDWASVPFGELEHDSCIGHLDAEGLRHYLPALMMSVLDHDDACSMRVIGTLQALDGREVYNQSRLRLLNEEQLRAIAAFPGALPNLVDLSASDTKVVSRSLKAYWSRYWAP